MRTSSHAMPENGTAFIILGADAVLAALPASPVQLAHACQALGFVLAAPATWGDELIAESCLEELAAYEHPAAVMCSCPLVTERLTRSSTLLAPFMLTFTAPPVATALYLRAAFAGESLHITYAGACPGANDRSIDARILPSDLLEACAERGIDLATQPNRFESLVPLDRRRFFSLPGGTPAREHVERLGHRALVELKGDEVVLELTQQLIEQTPALIDLAIPLGCVCAGGGAHSGRGNGRAGVSTLEPPRALRKLLDPSIQVDVSQSVIVVSELLPGTSEQATPIEVFHDADAAPAVSDAVDVSEGVEPFVESFVEPPVTDMSESIPPRRRGALVTRLAALVPRSVSSNGDMVPRASMAALKRVLARAGSRHARRDRDRAADARDAASRVATLRAPRASPFGAEPPIVPPPPARFRPRAMLGLG